MTDAPSTEPVESRIVYLGNFDGMLAFLWEPVADKVETWSEAVKISSPYEPKKKPRGLVAGAVYKTGAVIEADGRASRLVIPSKRDLVGHWANDELRMVAQERERAAELARRVEKDASDRQLLEILRPLRQMYQRTNHIGRLALEVQLLAALRTNPRS